MLISPFQAIPSKHPSIKTLDIIIHLWMILEIANKANIQYLSRKLTQHSLKL